MLRYFDQSFIQSRIFILPIAYFCSLWLVIKYNNGSLDGTECISHLVFLVGTSLFFGILIRGFMSPGWYNLSNSWLNLFGLFLIEIFLALILLIVYVLGINESEYICLCSLYSNIYFGTFLIGMSFFYYSRFEYHCGKPLGISSLFFCNAYILNSSILSFVRLSNFGFADSIYGFLIALALSILCFICFFWLHYVLMFDREMLWIPKSSSYKLFRLFYFMCISFHCILCFLVSLPFSIF